MPTKKPKISIRFLFNVCNDVEAMRHFYVDLIGLEQAAFRDDAENGWLALQCDGFQAMWFRATEGQDIPEQFTRQPGWQGGTRESTSWGVNIPEEEFVHTYQRLVDAGVTLYEAEPSWRQDCYWGLSALDPMGSTVEIYTEPAERPESTVWAARDRASA